MQSDDVLAFLDDHPDFLQHHADRLGLRPQQDRVVVSFADRQVLELKDRIRQLESRMAQLLRHGEANDVLQARSHRLALALSASGSTEATEAILRDTLSDAFGLDRMALKLWHPAAAGQDTIREEVRQAIRNLSAPYCGPYASDDIIAWFPETPVLQSFAQVPLRNRDGEAFGVMVLASDDPQRFTYDMHTHYLAQLGELVASTLLRTLEQP